MVGSGANQRSDRAVRGAQRKDGAQSANRLVRKARRSEPGRGGGVVAATEVRREWQRSPAPVTKSGHSSYWRDEMSPLRCADMSPFAFETAYGKHG